MSFTTRSESELLAWCERCRWPSGVECPFCRKPVRGARYRVANAPARKPSARTHREVYKCPACDRQFSITTRTRLDRTHLPLTVWAQAIPLAASGATPAAIARELRVTHHSASRILNRLRPVMGRAQPPEQIFARLLRERRPLDLA